MPKDPTEAISPLQKLSSQKQNVLSQREKSISKRLMIERRGDRANPLLTHALRVIEGRGDGANRLLTHALRVTHFGFFSAR